MEGICSNNKVVSSETGSEGGLPIRAGIKRAAEVPGQGEGSPSPWVWGAEQLKLPPMMTPLETSHSLLPLPSCSHWIENRQRSGYPIPFSPIGLFPPLASLLIRNHPHIHFTWQLQPLTSNSWLFSLTCWFRHVFLCSNHTRISSLFHISHCFPPLFCCSVFPTTGSVSQDDSHAIRQQLFGQLCNMIILKCFPSQNDSTTCNTAGVSTLWAQGQLLVQGTAPSSPQVGVQEGNSYLGGDFPRLWATIAIPGEVIRNFVVQKVQLEQQQQKSFAQKQPV